jgi:hypothetical protein
MAPRRLKSIRKIGAMDGAMDVRIFEKRKGVLRIS